MVWTLGSGKRRKFLFLHWGSRGGGASVATEAPIQTSAPMAPKCSVKWLHCAMFVLLTVSLCLALSGVDIELLSF